MADRDRYVRKTPPVGVAKQLAPAVGEDWDSSPTPSPVSVPEAIALVTRRQKLTQQTTLDTFDRVGDLRHELGGRIDKLDSRVDELTAQSANVSGKMDVLTDVVRRSLDEQSKIHVSRVTASIDVEKTSEISIIGERAARAAFPRELVLKVIAVAGPIIATAITLLATRC